MYKELAITIIILLIIFGLNKITQDYTDKSIEIMSKELEIVKQDILEQNPNKENSQNNANSAYEKWEEIDDVMAFYIEHNELEKVKTALTSIKSFIEIEEYSQGIESLDKCMYILEHIQEREKFTLDNIF